MRADGEGSGLIWVDRPVGGKGNDAQPRFPDDPRTEGAYVVRELMDGDGYELLVWCVQSRTSCGSKGWRRDTLNAIDGCDVETYYVYKMCAQYLRPGDSRAEIRFSAHRKLQINRGSSNSCGYRRTGGILACKWARSYGQYTSAKMTP